MAHIVVLGAGLGGVPAAYELKQALGKAHRLTVVSDRPYFQFTPSNPWVGVGWRKREDITIELAPIMQRRGIAFIASGAARLDPANSSMVLKNGETLAYDYLVIATGPELAFDEIEGLGPEGHTNSVCTVDHADKARANWETYCESPGPIIVGAVQGASCFGPAYEHAFIMEADLRRRGLRDKAPMTFVTSEPYVGHLGLGGVGDTRGMLESAMRHRHIRWICNARVDRVEAGLMHVTEHDEDGKPKKVHALPFAYSMMLPAFRGAAPLRGVEGLVNPRGFVVVDRNQRNARYPNIYSVGVCIAIPPLEQTPVPVGVPKTGYMIESMVTATVHNIVDAIHGRPVHAEPTLNALCLADFGDRGVAFIAQPQNPPRNISWSSEGRWVHWAKILFERYFLRKVRRGVSEPFYERYAMMFLKLPRLKGRFNKP